MNSIKAKNLTILFLFILNVILLSLVYVNSTKYTITKKQEDAILTLLNQRDISLDAKLLKSYKPMKAIIALPADEDSEKIASLLLGELDDVQVTTEIDRVIYTRSDENKDEHLEIQGSYFYFAYSNYLPDDNQTVETKETAVSLADEFLDKLSSVYTGFELYNVIEDEYWGDYIVEYRRVYKDNIIYSDFIRFYINEFGIAEIDCHYSNIEGFEQTPKEIRPVDEALYALMLELENRGANFSGEIVIKQMDIVYYQKLSGSFENASIKADPCYRFYVNIYDTPIIIDAAAIVVVNNQN